MTRRDGLIGVALCTVAAMFLFLDRAAMPIEMWDESRNMVSALEMAARGLALIPTYAGAPDLWNTKPPLLIWLMALCVRAFGASETALRLPSMVATIGTVALVYGFTLRTTRSAVAAVLAAALLVLSPAIYSEHSARTADYDSLLLFFVTAYLMLLFVAVERERPTRRLLAAIAAAMVCGFLTKSVAAFVPLAGVALYLLITRQFARIVRQRDYWLMAIAVMVGVAVYALLCEAMLPGYSAATLSNNVGVRFATAMQGTASRWFYFEELGQGYFAAAPLLLLSPLALYLAPSSHRAVLLYALCSVTATVAIYTIPAWRLHHYILPALPFTAIAVAITAVTLLGRALVWLGRGLGSKLAAGAIIMVLLVTLMRGAAVGVAGRYLVVPPFTEPSERYGALFAALAPTGRHVEVVEPGFVLAGKPHYAAVLLAYRDIWGARGVPIDQVTTLAEADPRPGAILASCDAATASALRVRGREIAGMHGCAAIIAAAPTPR